MFITVARVEEADAVRCEVNGHSPGRAHSPLVDRVLAAWRNLAERCRDLSRSGTAPSAAGNLSNLLTPDVRDVDDARQQWWWLHRRLRQPTPPRGPSVREIIQAYEEATGEVLGCD